MGKVRDLPDYIVSDSKAYIIRSNKCSMNYNGFYIKVYKTGDIEICNQKDGTKLYIEEQLFNLIQDAYNARDVL